MLPVLGIWCLFVVLGFLFAWNVPFRKKRTIHVQTLVTFLKHKVGKDCTRLIFAFVQPTDTAEIFAHVDIKICKRMLRDKMWTHANMFVRLAAANHLQGVSYFLKECNYATVVKAMEIACLKRNVDIVECLLSSYSFSEFSLLGVSLQLCKNISSKKNCQTCCRKLQNLELFYNNSDTCIMMASLLGISVFVPEYPSCNTCWNNTKQERAIKTLLRNANALPTFSLRFSRTCLLQFNSQFLDDITDLF